jgi:hypothetical protein
MAVGNKDHGGVPVPPAVPLGRLDKRVNLGWRQVFAGAQFAVWTPQRRSRRNCRIFGSWRHQREHRICREIQPLLQVVVANAGNDSELEMAFATFSQQRARGVVVSNGPFYNRRIDQLAALAARHALPAIFPYREFALAGGLMSHGSSLGDSFHQAGIYTGHILNGNVTGECFLATGRYGFSGPRNGPHARASPRAQPWPLVSRTGSAPTWFPAPSGALARRGIHAAQVRLGLGWRYCHRSRHRHGSRSAGLGGWSSPRPRNRSRHGRWTGRGKGFDLGRVRGRSDDRVHRYNLRRRPLTDWRRVVMAAAVISDGESNGARNEHDRPIFRNTESHDLPPLHPRQ